MTTNITPQEALQKILDKIKSVCTTTERSGCLGTIKDWCIQALEEQESTNSNKFLQTLRKEIKETEEYHQTISDCREDCIAFRQGFSYGVESYSDEDVELMTFRKILDNAKKFHAQQEIKKET